MEKHVSPLKALGFGLLAGAAAVAVQSLFFKATKKLSPRAPRGAFEAPELRQATEDATQTFARRFVEGLMKRGPLSEAEVARGAKLVQLATGVAWGGVYGLARETSPLVAGPLGALGYGTLVWMVTDNGIVPALRLGGWPQRYPAKVHAYAWLAHAAYALGLAVTYGALRRRPVVAAGAALGAARLWSELPSPTARRALRWAKKASRPIARAAESLAV